MHSTEFLNKKEKPNTYENEINFYELFTIITSGTNKKAI